MNEYLYCKLRMAGDPDNALYDGCGYAADLILEEIEALR